MKLETCRDLVEMIALALKVEKKSGEIKAHERRVTFIESQRTNRSLEVNKNIALLDESKKKLCLEEKELFDLEASLTQMGQNKTMVTSEEQSFAMDKQMKILGEKKDLLESEIFQKMEREEELEIVICEGEKFLEGSLSSLKEIQKEVESDIEKENNDIFSYENRVSSLLEQNEKIIKETYLLAKKNLKYPIALIINKTCNGCHFILDSVTESEVHRIESPIVLCPNCGRLLTVKI